MDPVELSRLELIEATDLPDGGALAEGDVIIGFREGDAFAFEATGLGGGGGASALDDLSDVTILERAVGETLVWDGSQFVNQVVSGGSASQTADFLIEYVSGTHGTSATYRLTRQDATTVEATDGGGVAAMNTLISTALDEKPNGVHIHFAAGRFHALDSITGVEAWAGEEDHMTFGGSGQQYQAIVLSGEGIDSTIISNRSNWTGAADTEAMSFTNAQAVTIRDLTVESCGCYKSTTDAIDFDQGSECIVDHVLIRRARARGIVVDGGDVGRHARHASIRNVIIQGRPPRPGLLPLSGGTLTASTQYAYCVTWVDADLAGASTAGETKPSEVAPVLTTASNKGVRIYVPRGCYTTTERRVYRWSAASGWVHIATASGSAAVVVNDTGLASLGAATFTTRSAIFESGIELLGCSDSNVTDCFVDGIGDGVVGLLGNGINLVRKNVVPTPSDRNVVSRCHVVAPSGHGIRITGGSYNLVVDNYVRNVGFPATKRNGLRVEGIAGVSSNYNRFAGNVVIDDRDANSPDGGAGMANAYSVTATNTPTSNRFYDNQALGFSTLTAMTDGGTSTVDLNTPSAPLLVLTSAAAVPTGTAIGTVILRTP